eukprot:CAMPEP_0113302980 /NCGR_PEP_ID=MMETSP0010_2-20120614/3586_1 /TAXON_ID=216773 ORGANISM="Corethron hystrix, Strain 308" /NCGR_SAMPLE_ID=MMETSP0010_2 /ASSEMBLY_ACC=CAM_ASM_000155 /LENGTH=256 /DNA_ID=CAMNT_0000156899 /DNA_START=43 /DNA_END=813 /DNA_ORIENTATION=+ /assembly_acc=CAM_ASM_000155
MTSTAIKRVVVSVAMEAEAKPFVEHLGLKIDEGFFSSAAPFLAYRGIFNENCHITVVTSGKDNVHGTGVDNVGTVPGSLSTFLSLEKMKTEAPDEDLILINAGTCGGFGKAGADIGDVYITTESLSHDRRIPLGPFAEYGIGKVSSIGTENLKNHLVGSKHGVCTTGNSLDFHDTDMKIMMDNGAHVKDMEASGIAWSCALHGVPHFGVKVVTDIVDGDRPAAEEFMENLGKAAESLQNALPKVIDYVCGKDLSEL